jgi:hypothetical protein
MGKFVRPLQGEILRENRSDERRTLRLSARVSSSGDWAQVLIHDLSEKGLMFETSAKLEIGEIVSVDLPFIGKSEAKIVRKEDDSFGCEFTTPVSRKTVSAALLQASGDLRDSEIESTVEEMPVGIKPSLEDMTKWKLHFEKAKGAQGYRLVGFRQAPDGMTIAMITKTN